MDKEFINKGRLKVGHIIRLKKGMFFTPKQEFYPLYRKGDKFKIVKINKEKDLLPIESLHLRTKQIYGFERDEIQIIKTKLLNT